MSSLLRVLHVTASMSPARGGPTVVVRDTMRTLRRRGIAVDVATTDDDTATTRLHVPLDRFVQVDGQRIRYFPRQTSKYGFSHPLLAWLRANVRGYDLVHTHGLFSFAPLAGAWCARAAGVPCVMAPHGVLDTWGMKNKSRLAKSVSVRLVEGPLLRSAAAIHFMTPLEQSRAAQLPLSVRPVVLPAGVVDLDAPAEEDLEPLGGPALEGRDLILYLARIHPIKCVDVLLRAFAALPDRDPALVIAGDGDPSLVASLKQLAAELRLGERVQWLGFTEGARKRWLLSQAAVFVLPSASENFGVAAVEAMHAGLPVIVTSGCGLASFVADWEAGIVTDGSVEALRSALAHLLGDEGSRRRMGQAGRSAVRRELSLEAYGAKLEALYRSILDGDSSSLGLAAPAIKP